MMLAQALVLHTVGRGKVDDEICCCSLCGCWPFTARAHAVFFFQLVPLDVDWRATKDVASEQFELRVR